MYLFRERLSFETILDDWTVAIPTLSLISFAFSLRGGGGGEDVGMLLLWCIATLEKGLSAAAVLMMLMFAVFFVALLSFFL